MSLSRIIQLLAEAKSKATDFRLRSEGAVDQNSKEFFRKEGENYERLAKDLDALRSTLERIENNAASLLNHLK